MKKDTIPKELLKINIFITLLIVIENLVLFLGFNAGKSLYITINAYISTVIFFIYLYLLALGLNNKLNDIKKEILYINYPLNIFTFLIFLLIILFVSAAGLLIINREAANAAFIFTFFMSTVSMLFPSIILIALIYFIIPAFVIPSIGFNPKNTKKGKKKEKSIFMLITILFCIFIVFSVFNIWNSAEKSSNFAKQTKYKSAKMTINFATTFLKLKDISAYSQKLMSKDKFKIPFFYTETAFPYEDYKSADRFCRALDARVPNYLEIYHIVFNRFDTFGEQYYWTSDKDGKYPLVLHFKNMSYEIIKKPDNVKPLLYCAASADDNFGFENKTYFYRNIYKENQETIEEMTSKQFDFDLLKTLKNIENKNEEVINTPPEPEDNINGEKKHVNFSVKEVTKDVFDRLNQSGYNYSVYSTISREYETNNSVFSSSVRKNTDKIRLCYYPFTDYSNLDLSQEKEIWKQSFCSPAFDLVDKPPVLKSKYDKDSYCFAYGGRLPNIPELNGILVTLGINRQNVKFWINSKITSLKTHETIPVLVYYKNQRFMTIKALETDENDNAYVLCIKNSQNPSVVIANYKSRFHGEEGSIYAKQICPHCKYYEAPDTILHQ